MSITNKTIALVIVTYNRCNLLMEMLSSIENMSVKPDIVYVIDNNSSDNTSSVVTECDSRKNINIKYHNTGYNAGGAGGFYIGSKMMTLFWIRSVLVTQWSMMMDALSYNLCVIIWTDPVPKFQLSSTI